MCNFSPVSPPHIARVEKRDRDDFEVLGWLKVVL